MSVNNKIKAYIGFAKKSRNIIFGIDDILKSKKIELVLLSSDLSQNSESQLKNKLNNRCEIIKIESTEFSDYLSSDKIKIIAITDKNLSEAIKSQLN